MNECYYKADGLSDKNAYLSIKSTNVSITNCEFNLNNAVYNFLEWPSGDATNKISSVTITGNTFDCTGMTHNVINMFNFENNAKIDLTNNVYKNVNFSKTNPVRISNYKNAATNVTIDISNSKIEGVTNGSTAAYNTFVLFQDYAGSTETQQDFSTFTLKACGDYFKSMNTTLVKYSKGGYYKDLLVVYSNNHVSDVKMPKVTLDSGSYESVDTLFSGGKGTEADPYLVSSADELNNINHSSLSGKTLFFKLTSDISISDKLVIKENVTIDLGNHKITMKKETTGGDPYTTFKVDGDCTVNIKNGSIDATAITANINTDGTDDECDVIWATYGTVNLEDLNIIMNNCKGACAYTSLNGSNHGKINIISGTYENKAEKYKWKDWKGLLVNSNNNINEQSIFISGGTFIGQNPGDGDDNSGKKFIAEGYEVETVTEGEVTKYVVKAQVTD